MMRRTFRTLILLLCAAVMIGAFAVTANASEFADPETALGYLESYADNVAADPNFDANIEESLSTVRQDVHGYATFMSLLPPIIAIALALITKEVYTSLMIGVLSGALLYSNFNIWGMLTNTADVIAGKAQRFLECGYPDFPGAAGYDGQSDQQGRRFCCLRPLGIGADQEPHRRHPVHRTAGHDDLY